MTTAIVLKKCRAKDNGKTYPALYTKTDDNRLLFITWDIPTISRITDMSYSELHKFKSGTDDELVIYTRKEL